VVRQGIVVIRDQAFEIVAHAPGHITGFFAIEDEAEDPMAIGSVGAGFSVEAGVTSRVRMRRQGFPGVHVTINGRNEEAETTREAVGIILGKEPWQVEIEQEQPLLVGQGFGVSAAAALSAALAVAGALGRSAEEARAAAHAAEVVNRTGLGDVVGSFAGGAEIRLRPGVPPHGLLEPFDVKPGQPVQLVAVAETISTRKILRDPLRREGIIEAGRRHVQEFQKERDLASFCRRSREFAKDTGLMPDVVAQALDRLLPTALASQCMLGGSLFVFGERKSVPDPLPVGWTLISTRVSSHGARIVEGPRAI
jgi:pantoate kinase